mmetsp:Transcript_18604/g.59229  ORF Transcript_18604/g.59229 Transcript_18604/m.59229 type:complete len:203 (+) Transcript_18604:214-822(+)
MRHAPHSSAPTQLLFCTRFLSRWAFPGRLAPALGFPFLPLPALMGRLPPAPPPPRPPPAPPPPRRPTPGGIARFLDALKPLVSAELLASFCFFSFLGPPKPYLESLTRRFLLGPCLRASGVDPSPGVLRFLRPIGAGPSPAVSKDLTLLNSSAAAIASFFLCAFAASFSAWICLAYCLCSCAARRASTAFILLCSISSLALI